MSLKRLEARVEALEQERRLGILLILDRAEFDRAERPPARRGIVEAWAEPGESIDAVLERLAMESVPLYIIRRRIVRVDRQNEEHDEE